MGKDLGVAVGEGQREFVGKPFPIMQDLGSILFLLFPMVGELDGAPMRDVTIFTVAENSVASSP